MSLSTPFGVYYMLSAVVSICPFTGQGCGRPQIAERQSKIPRFSFVVITSTLNLSPWVSGEMK